MTLTTRVLLLGPLLLLVADSAHGRAATSQALVRLPGHVLPALTQATPLTRERKGAPAFEPSDGAQPLTATIVLKRDDPAGFERYLLDVCDPASPTYRRFLTPSQVSDRFGPSRSAYDAVPRYLQRHGFTLVQGSANRLTLTVRGTRAAAAHAFAVRIADYQLG